jgi:hypothetical protein
MKCNKKIDSIINTNVDELSKANISKINIKDNSDNKLIINENEENIKNFEEEIKKINFEIKKIQSSNENYQYEIDNY